MTLPVPHYPASRPLELSDRSLLHGLFHDLQPVVSELSFANLFLFRHIHKYRLTSVNGSITVFGCGYDERPYFLPPLSADRGAAARRLLDEGNSLYGTDQQFAEVHLAGSHYTLHADRDNDDYLYLRSDLADLPGKLFHKKKNRVSYFTSRHRYRCEPLRREHLASALSLLDEWDRVHSAPMSPSLAAETAATREGLLLADELGLSGLVVLTDSGVCAFALGEPLNETTFVCHFEKADPFLEGAAQLVNREFSRFLPAEYIYINREQDLGESGLKAAKSSYHPTGMIRKFRAKLQE